MALTHSFFFGVLYLSFTVLNILADGECDPSTCPGPLQYYKDLKCKPIYKTPDSCCPYKFDCDHLKSRPKEKCIVNDHEYAIGDSLKDEDANPCDISCTCDETLGVAQFSCAEVDCPEDGYVNETCYSRQNAADCCGGEIVCPENPEDRPTCEVDGKIYKDGEFFKPSSEPNKNCYCGPGYTGQNIEPFCKTNAYECGAELHHAYEIHNDCVPTYYNSQSPQTDCSVAYRCQNDKDEVIKRLKTPEDPEMDVTCKFGNLIMNYGDELNQATGYSSVCVKCVCEVGPVPTCQRLPDSECDVTVHPPFDE
ncbi:kielin/chordin-like protein [Microplitis demolitor]|uniref:kielin/chordin-like protein n=1 Tax=Microplitis demolitor TaxID=69319 RepID=UPI0004CD6B86|nr:kielin/chordin-like protein [Microplitis demolitor]